MRHVSTLIAASLLFLGCGTSSNDDHGTPGADSGSTDGASAGDTGSDAPVAILDAGGNTIEGSVGGVTLTIADDYMYDETYDFGAAGVPVVVHAIKLTSYANACALQQQSDSHEANGRYLKFYFGHEGSAPLTPGTYPIVLLSSIPTLLAQAGADAGAEAGAVDAGVTLLAAAQFKEFDTSCNATLTDATSGSLVVDDLSSGAKGTFSLAFPNGDSLTGTFDVPVCTVSPPNAIPVCSQ